MKRLTQRDEYGNADIIGVDSLSLQGNLAFDEFNRVTAALNRLAHYEDLDEQGRLVVLPISIGSKVYHITTCKNFPKRLDGTLYDGSGGHGTATGYYCPCELLENCPFEPEDFDCEKNGENFAFFEDVITSVLVGEDGEEIGLDYSGWVRFSDFGKTVFLTREEAEAALVTVSKEATL